MLCFVVWLNTKTHYDQLFLQKSTVKGTYFAHECICLECYRFTVWSPGLFSERAVFTSFGKNPKEHAYQEKGFFTGGVIWDPWEQQIKASVPSKNNDV